MGSTDLQEFLWGNRQEPLYAVQPTEVRWKPVRKQLALDRLARGKMRYFAPVPRLEQGNKSIDCARHFDALWCDIDRDSNVDPCDLLAEAKGSLATLGLLPSAAVFTGNRGIHLYWKLAGDLPIARVEDRNRQLAQVIHGDHCHDRARLLRHPGSIHEKSGRGAEIIEFSAEVHDLARLEALGPLAPAVLRNGPADPARTDATDDAWLRAAEALGGWGEPEFLNLSGLMAWQRAYIDAQPKRGWRSRGQSRSEIEQSIVYRLVGAGASDAQIKEFADLYLARHREEYQQRGDYYIDRTIAAARREHFDRGSITSPLGGCPRKREAKYRHATADELLGILDRVQGQPVAEFVKAIVATGRARSTAYRLKHELATRGFLTVADGCVRPAHEQR